jgi:histidinol-phosphatase (PHP family)
VYGKVEQDRSSYQSPSHGQASEESSCRFEVDCYLHWFFRKLLYTALNLALKLANYHSHTFRCQHAAEDVLSYVQAARDAGMEIFGASDHAALPDNRWPEVRMRFDELDDYIEAVQNAAQAVPQVQVLLGMECEYIPEFHHYYADDLLGTRQFSYLIGAGHYTPYHGEWINSFVELRTATHLRAYAQHLEEMMRTGLFAFIAHPDLFGAVQMSWTEEVAACSRDILAAAVDTGTPLEINGYGLRKVPVSGAEGPRPPYPWRPFWDLAAEYPVQVVCNSDCHHPRDVVAGIRENQELAASLGLALADLSHLQPIAVNAHG